MKNLLATAALILSWASISQARIIAPTPRTMLLATESLADRGQNTFRRVESCRRGFHVEAVKLRVLKNPAQVERLVLHFANGQTQEAFVREHFAAGSDSRWIDLRGTDRCLEGFRIMGESLSPGRGNSTIQLWGSVHR